MPGVLAVRGTDGEELILAANAFSAEESDTSRHLTVQVPDLKSSESIGTTADSSTIADSAEKTYFEPPITIFLLVVLLVDLTWRITTRSRWGGVT